MKKTLYIRGRLLTFSAQHTPRNAPLKSKNNGQTTSEELQTNFQKVQRTIFFPENGQNDPLRGPNVDIQF